MKKVVLSTLAIAALVFSSCSDDNDNNIDTAVTAPATYTFERNGATSVSFSGQTTRIKMGEKLISALKDKSKTKIELDSMFGRNLTTHSYFNDAELDGSSKNLRGKTAASIDYFPGTAEAVFIKEDFDGFISSQVTEVFPNWNVDAVEGTAGKIQELGTGGSMRYVNAKGLEYNQAFGKGLIGALMVDQILNNYLSTKKLDEATSRADNDAGILIEGKNYTNMEHKWDEAYGYLYGKEATPASPELGADSFLNKYLKRVEDDADFAGIADKIYNAFKLGRAAIVAKDYELRDKQVEILREEISKIIAVRAVYYLQYGKDKLATDKGAAFHDLSEGYGFVYSLRFTQTSATGAPHLTVDEINEFVSTLQAGNGFWTITNDELEQMSTKIANAYGFTVGQAR
ncbi:DUF4856 domain-containing protein [Tenacibaculum sp. MAR_2009_124]|uniref:DUF4856 domain-containing protein n=1 Tax=Tenacibaculum sp. MAR_2009_124 TaxID=1250059 RepID=UPI000B8945A8|nr:DUF4856 domain-containing protein [Tenacibaculum sp. MAR_2009_124]